MAGRAGVRGRGERIDAWGRDPAAGSRAPVAEVVVFTGDDQLLDQVLSVTAALGLEPEVVGDLGALRPRWSAARAVLIGVDQASRVAGLGLPRRGSVYLVGDEGGREEVYAWSVPLGAAVVTLPGQASWLAGALADVAAGQRGTGCVLGVVGGSGGVGASTLAAALAFAAARRPARSMLIDADHRGGGLDLLFGAERVDGWRWPRLTGASGHLGDLSAQLPQVEGMDVLSMARGGAARPLSGPQLAAVLGSAVRSHAYVVVDLPRSLGEAAEEVLACADLTVLLVAADVRGVAAAQTVIAALVAATSSVGMVVRRRSGGIEAGRVADGLGLPLLGTVADDPALAVAAERGEPPARSPRSGLARLAQTILDEVPVRAGVDEIDAAFG